jgi:hypothetical protein
MGGDSRAIIPLLGEFEGAKPPPKILDLYSAIG